MHSPLRARSAADAPTAASTRQAGGAEVSTPVRLSAGGNVGNKRQATPEHGPDRQWLARRLQRFAPEAASARMGGGNPRGTDPAARPARAASQRRLKSGGQAARTPARRVAWAGRASASHGHSDTADAVRIAEMPYVHGLAR